MRILYIILIILSANQFLNFGSWWHVQGKFNVADLGNLLVWLGVFGVTLRKGIPKEFRSPLSLLIIAYLFFVCFQIGLGSFYYNQSLVKSILGTRHQFYFLSFFLFLQLLDTPARIRQLLNWLTVIALFAVLLGLINYFGPTILSHKWAEGQRIRSGISRGFLPGMSIISFAVIWEISKWGEGRTHKNKFSFLWGWLLIGAHFFRQSRMRLFGVVAVLAGLLFFKRKFRHLIISVSIAVVAIVVVDLYLPENIIINQFSVAAENVSGGSGSWRGRLIQLETDFKEFKKHPIVGSGTSTIRLESVTGYGSTIQAEMFSLAYKADLGYSHWVKAYGLVGLVWLLAFFFLLWHYARKTVRMADEELKDITTFSISFAVFVIGTFITLNHLMFPSGIVLVCLIAAIIIRMKYFLSALQPKKQP